MNIRAKSVWDLGAASSFRGLRFNIRLFGYRFRSNHLSKIALTENTLFSSFFGVNKIHNVKNGYRIFFEQYSNSVS